MEEDLEWRKRREFGEGQIPTGDNSDEEGEKSEREGEEPGLVARLQRERGNEVSEEVRKPRLDAGECVMSASNPSAKH